MTFKSGLGQEDLFQDTVYQEKELNKAVWTRLVKERDNHTCQFSIGDSFRKHNGPIEAHHRLPKKYGGKYVLSNGITLCKNCHAQFLIEAEQEYYPGVIKNFYLLLKDFVNGLFGLPKVGRCYKVLKYLTGKNEFRDCQLEAIQAVLENKRNVVFVSPTGSGKSIVYQIAGILMQIQSLIIAPLNALQKDQVQSLWKKWVTATYINSELKRDEKNKRIASIMSQGYSFIFAHPKQLLVKNIETDEIGLKFSSSLLESPLGMLCIDEAHVINTWGLQFVEEYDNLNLVRKKLNYLPTILLSASLTKNMQNYLIGNLFKDDEKPLVFVTGFGRPNISLFVEKFPKYSDELNMTKLEYLEYLLKENTGKKIIFCTTTKEVDELTLYLKGRGYNADGFHSKILENDKKLILEKFTGNIQPELEILVGTSAVGMGINIPDIRVAIHYSLPFNLNDYYQQFGRIGRDGKPAKAYLFYDESQLKNNITDWINSKQLEKIKDEEKKLNLIEYFKKEKEDLTNYIKTDDKWQFILDYFGETKTIEVNTSKYIFYIVLIILFIIWWISQFN